ncbi:MAG: glycosyltransferase family 4 protein [Actinobacteria bacterium]|nr:glycosyltransferase family 4 protein [Actinomycetota bacterium]
MIDFLSSREVFDVPNHRSSHEGRVVRGLGLSPAIVCGTVGAIAASRGAVDLWTVVAAGTVLALLGFVDDARGLSVGLRLPVQMAVGVAVSVAILQDGLLSVPAVISVLWFAGYVNAFNFMDGINGISGTHAAIAGSTWLLAGALTGASTAAAIGSIVAAGALGFLPFNFPSARAFLGDVGSYFFGAWLAAGALIIATEIGIAVAVLPLSLYLSDTGWTLLARLRRGLPWHQPHRDHVYQRLVRGGWSHARTTGVVAAFTLLLGASGFAASTSGLVGVLVPVVSAVVLNVLYLSVPSLVFDDVPAVGG